MKYQQLENLEAGWKWLYLLNKYRMGEPITRYLDSSEQEHAIYLFLKLEHEPIKVVDWINKHLNPELEKKLKQAIRAKRKRHFNSEQEHTRKKSIDLDYRIWEMLSKKAQELNLTLSETIEYLVNEASITEKASKTVSSLKADLHALLK